MTLACAILGVLFGLLLLGMSVLVAGIGHGSTVFMELFLAPVGFNLFLVPIWWGFMFAMIGSSLSGVIRWSVFVPGECIHFIFGIMRLGYLPEMEWERLSRMAYKSYASMFFLLLFFGTYIFMHLILFKLLCYSRKTKCRI